MTQTQSPHKGINSDQLSITNPIWEVNTAYVAAQQVDYGSKPVSAHKRVGSFMTVDLDPDGSGTISTTSIAQNASAAQAGQRSPVSFNWDNTNYPKKVGWVSANDGMLVLDKDFNQSVDNGTELRSNPLVADPAKGLRSLTVHDEWVGNYSQKRSALCPYDCDIWLKNLENWKVKARSGRNPEKLKVCQRVGNREKPIFHRKKWQCQRHMDIVSYQKNIFCEKYQMRLKLEVAYESRKKPNGWCAGLPNTAHASG